LSILIDARKCPGKILAVTNEIEALSSGDEDVKLGEAKEALGQVGDVEEESDRAVKKR
jgi:hypothetical protein